MGFRRDLYRGTADDYDSFRPPYPSDLIDDLADRSGADGTGVLLDLACGTGQITFALHDRFRQVWAVDQEPDMVDLVRRKARAADIDTVRPLVSAAEDLPASPGTFDLVAIGNAFHRMPRDEVAATVRRWLRPGGSLALLWGDNPWNGPAPWQAAMAAVLERWATRLGTHDRVPADYAETRRRRPDLTILRESGFEIVGSYEYPATRVWTADTLIGFAYSMSVFPRVAFGDLAAEFERDVRDGLDAAEPAGPMTHTIPFAYDLARRADLP